MNDTLADGLRWVIVALGFVAAVVMFGGLAAKLRAARQGRRQVVSFAERCAHVGGGLICLFLATGTLGVLLGWDSAFRLPMMTCALGFTIVGRGAEWREEIKRGKP